MLYSLPGVDFFSTSELLYLDYKKWVQIIRGRIMFHVFGGNPNVSLWIVDSSPYTRRIALLMFINRNERTCLPILLWSSIFWRFSKRRQSFPLEKASSFRKTLLTMLQFVGLLLQWSKSLLSLDFTLKIYFGINDFISDSLEHSVEVKHPLQVLLTIFAYTIRPWKQWFFNLI